MNFLHGLVGVTIAIFMAGSLFEMGLKLDVKKAGSALGDMRFTLIALLWSFAIGPALAVLVARVMPLAEPYELGLILLGLAPCAPFVPLLSGRAGADLNYVAAYLLLASIGTLIMLPIAIPVLAPQLSADALTIAKPLVLFIALPLAIGIIIRLINNSLAAKSHPIVKKLTAVDIAIMLGIVVLLYWRDFLGAVGSYAIAAQILYFARSPVPPTALASASRMRRRVPSCSASLPATSARPWRRCCRLRV
jgi:BASS family bile acid:Na+ symporter